MIAIKSAGKMPFDFAQDKPAVRKAKETAGPASAKSASVGMTGNFAQPYLGAFARRLPAHSDREQNDAPLDNNTSLVLKGDVLCTANLGFTHAKPQDADRTVVCMKGFPVPK